MGPGTSPGYLFMFPADAKRRTAGLLRDVSRATADGRGPGELGRALSASGTAIPTYFNTAE